MSDTDDLAVRLLRTYADVHTPGDADVARLARRLARSRAVVPLPRARPRRGLAVVALASAAAAVLVLGLVDRVDRTPDESSARPGLHDFDGSQDRGHDMAGTHRDDDMAGDRSPIAPAVIPAAELPPHAAPPTLPAPIRGHGRHDADTRPPVRTDVEPPANPNADGLAAEAAAIRGIAEAVRAGAIDAAARGLAAYHQAFPRGTLAAEAEALDAIVACRRGRSPSARAGAQRLLERHPDAAFGRRVRDECDLGPASNPTNRTEPPASEQPE